MRSFWEFQHVRLPIKFAIALVLLSAGLVFMGASYYQTIVIEEQAQARTEKLDTVLELTHEVKLNISSARYYEKSLLLEHDLEHFSRFNQRMEAADKALQALKQYLRSDQDKTLIDEFEQIVDLYQDTFYEGAEAAIEAGLTLELGLTGELRQLVAESDARIDWTGRDWLRDLFVQLTSALDAYISSGGGADAKDKIYNQLQEMINKLSATQRGQETEALESLQRISDIFSDLVPAVELRNKSFINLQSIVKTLEPKFDQVTKLTETYEFQDAERRAADTLEMVKYFFAAMIMMTTALAIALSIIKYGVIDPVNRIQGTINRVRAGDNNARSQLDSEDELGQLAKVLDTLLDEKEAALQAQAEENKRLNASVIELIQNVFRLSQRDLTVRVPVAEDITGAVADSINQLATSMETVLHEVRAVSARVNSASLQVKAQSSSVLSHAEQEQVEITATLQGLESATKAMQLISKLATLSNSASQKAIRTSETAMDSVSQTINSINQIRQTIHEAEKRIKRLGERSQEIGGIVGLINNISERTHVLSLNASMHAASAGEAGRGLMVVVDEVQRLAENSREATAEIESLVNNIQLETADTINIMNTVISDVVDGTRLAEEAGQRMSETRSTTQTLVESVIRIAQNATRQAQVAEQLRERASSIDASTQATNREMRQQTLLSDDLVTAANELQQAISVFTLAQQAEPPAAAAPPSGAVPAESVAIPEPA